MTSVQNNDGNIEDFFRIDIYRYFSENIDIYRHCVFTIEMKRDRYNVHKYDEKL